MKLSHQARLQKTERATLNPEGDSLDQSHLLPMVVQELGSPEADRLRAQGHKVLTFEQCAELMA